MYRCSLTQEKLKYRLSYDPLTGVFIWLRSPRYGWAGKVAGSPAKSGHICILIDGVSYKAHRLAWLYMTGEWPESDLDHEDTSPANNVFKNLRPATKLQNNHNAKKPVTNTSGVKGVKWMKHNRKWAATVTHDAVRHYLGLFTDINEAAEAVRLKREELHAEFANHG